MYHHFITSTILSLLFINICVGTSVQFCNKTEVLLRENSTSVCVNKSEVNSEEIFSKCCPLNYSYDTQSHSCLRNCANVIVDFVSDFKDLKVTRNGIVLMKTGKSFTNGKYCLDDVYNSDLIVVRSCEDSDECGQSYRCLRKCCSDLEIYVGGATCQPSVEHVFNYQNWSKANEIIENDFSIIPGLFCKKYLVKKDINYNLDEWGNINLLELNTWKHYKPYEDVYCIEHLERKSSNEDKVFMCLTQPAQKYNYTKIAMIISCVFILLTIISYIWLLENFNVFSKAVVSYCISLFITYLLLTYVQWSIIGNITVCTALAYVITAFMISTFVWMNALCIDIWLTFGSDNALMTIKEDWEDRKRFLLYSLYGWGLPIILTSLVALLKYTNFPPQWLRPLLGDAKCLMYSVQGNYSKLIFFVLPITALKICDVILFIKTSIHCIEVKSAIANMKEDKSSCDWKRRFLMDKEKLALLIKLFIIMGIPWLFEVLTSIIRFDKHPVLSKIETTWDILNCLQGVYVFAVFVCKRKVFEILLKKTKLRKRKLSMSSAVTQSSVMVTRHYSAKHQ